MKKSLPRTPSLPKTFDLIESLISAFTDSKKPSQEQGRLFFFGNPLQRGFDKDESLWGGKGEVWRGEGGPFFRKALPLHPQRLSPLSNPYCRGLPRTEKPSPNTGKAFCYRGKPEAGQNEGSGKAAAFLRFCPRYRVSSGYTSTSGARSERASGSLARRAG